MRTIFAFPILTMALGAQHFAAWPDAPALVPLAGFERPVRIALADIDGDGDADAAVTTTIATVVLRNLGGGAWSSMEVMPIAADAMAWADLDGDGDRDLLLGGRNISHPFVPFGVLRNDGTGFTWLGQITLTFGTGQVSGFAIGDVDGDGDHDVVVGAQGYVTPTGPTLQLYRNDGSANLTWDPTALPTLTGQSHWPVMLDVEGDGDQDLLAARADTQVVMLRNIGGSFVDATAALPPGVTARFLATGDLDGDARPDVVTCDGGTAVLWNGPGGTFAPVQALAPGTDEAMEPQLADCDGDGDLDIVVRTRRGLEQRRNLGGHAFGVDVLWHGSRATVGLGIGDTGGRGLPDVIGTLSGDSPLWAQGSPSGLFLEPRPRAASGAGPKAVGDLDNDGLDDIVVQSSSGTQVLRQVARGGWNVTTSITTPPMNWLRVRLAHMDGDGQLDAVALGSSPIGAVFVLLRRPNSLEFQAVLSGIGLLGATELDVGDVDGDGDIDVVATSSQGAMLLANPGNGALLAPARLPGTAAVQDSICLLRDVDGDGDPDLLLGPTQGCLAIHWNDGAGGFTAGPCLPHAGTAVPAATVADLDLDGRRDVAFVAMPGGQVQWYRQHPAGQFLAGASPSPVAGAPDALDAADYDDDGDMDLLLAGDPAVLLRNDGAGSFTADTGAVPGRLRRVASLDFDQDGDIDLVGDVIGGVALANGARSAQCPLVPALGGILRIDFTVDPGRATPGTLVIPAASFTLAPGLAVPGVRGTLLLDAGPTNLPWVTPVTPAGTARLDTAVPVRPELVGMPIAIQALSWSPAQGPGFSNVVDQRIRP